MPKLSTILDKALVYKELSVEEGLFLLAQSESSAVQDLQTAADELRRQLVGETVTYVINRNINFTNICEQHCSFCAFRKDEKDDDAYWLSESTILQKAKDAVDGGATEICMQGGLHPKAKRQGRSLLYYVHLIESIKQVFPQLHLHAFSPQEVEFIAREDNIDIADVLIALKAAGVESMPGTAAEVLDDDVRRVLCPEKINSQTWLDIVSQAHQVGIPTTSTMLCGHIETPEQQIRHLMRLRSLQQASLDHNNVGITEFILLPYVGETAPKSLRRKVGHDQPNQSDILKLTAVSRLYLGSYILNHQPSWVKLGIDGAQRALEWGCNDLGGTLMEEHITTSAGAKGGTGLTTLDLQQAIVQLKRPWQQRTTLYKPVQISSFESSKSSNSSFRQLSSIP